MFQDCCRLTQSTLVKRQPLVRIVALGKVNSGRAPSKQLSLFSGSSEANEYKARSAHGGELAKGRRKRRRPLVHGKWVHVVLRTTNRRPEWSLLAPRHRVLVSRLLRQKARKFGVTLADGVNIGNHLHLKVRFSHRDQFAAFLRAVTCWIAKLITGAKKGSPKGRFWDGLAFTRVLRSGAEELNLRNYFEINRVERAKGHEARLRLQRDFQRWVRSLVKAQALAETG